MFVRLENGKDIVRQIREVACVTQSGSVKETLAEYWRTLFN
jgi:hypothetical protein